MFDSFIYHLRGKRWARSLAPGDYHDLLDLWNRRVISVTAKGKSITELYVDVHNHWDKTLKIVIPPGTYFQSRGAHQNMVVRKEYVFDIAPGKLRFLQVEATCLNADRPIPERADHFRGVDRVDPLVARFLKGSEGCSAMAVQAGVWSLTDGYDREQIKSRLYTVSSAGHASTGISDVDMDSAARLLNQLGIASPLTL